MRVLGIDLGQKRVGLAISDPMGWTAQSLETLGWRGDETTLKNLVALCRENAVTSIVVGLPVNMNGTLGPKAEQVMTFVEKLRQSAGIEVVTWDERLTSRQASRLMIHEGLSRKKQKESSDKLAALLILQSYLDSKRISENHVP